MPDSQTPNATQQIADAAFAFGAESAKSIDPAIFDDPIMHNYFLFYIYGAVDWLGTHWQEQCVIDEQEKLDAMTQALLIMEPDKQETAQSFSLLAQKSDDKHASDIKNAGAQAIQDWLIDPDGNAAMRFSELLKLPDKFPRTVDPSD